MRVFLSNLGCKLLNQAELEGLARRFVAAGHRISASLAEADLHVVNSCTVTRAAARDSRKVARRGGRHGRRLRTVLTGCYVNAEPAVAAALAGVDLVVPNEDKERLVERVHEAFPEAVPAAARLPVPYVPLEFGNSRALVKIEDGCNMRCSFCVIPLTRGPQRSRAPKEVIAEVGALAAGGFREVVITGVQISAYRAAGRGLFELVSELLERVPAARLRLTSIAPWQFDRRLLDLFTGGQLCRHFHLSLQSGCDATLRRMRRPYTAAQFTALVEEIRDAVPGVAVTTDVIVGFPGEDGAEFEQSLAAVEGIGFARVHAFPYSARPGTEAAGLPGQVPHPERRRRMQQILATAARCERRFRRAQLGRVARVLWEDRRRGRWRGTTDNYIRVLWSGDEEPHLPLGVARLTALSEDGVRGEPAPTAPPN